MKNVRKNTTGPSMREKSRKPTPKMVMPMRMSAREPNRQPALQRAEDAALRARHGERRRHDRLAPAELLAQQHGVRPVGVEHERADQELDAEAGGDDPPAIEERAAGHARF